MVVHLNDLDPTISARNFLLLLLLARVRAVLQTRSSGGRPGAPVPAVHVPSGLALVCMPLLSCLPAGGRRRSRHCHPVVVLHSTHR